MSLSMVQPRTPSGSRRASYSHASSTADSLQAHTPRTLSPIRELAGSSPERHFALGSSAARPHRSWRATRRDVEHGWSAAGVGGRSERGSLSGLEGWRQPGGLSPPPRDVSCKSRGVSGERDRVQASLSRDDQPPRLRPRLAPIAPTMNLPAARPIRPALNSRWSTGSYLDSLDDRLIIRPDTHEAPSVRASMDEPPLSGSTLRLGTASASVSDQEDEASRQGGISGFFSALFQRPAAQPSASVLTSRSRRLSKNAPSASSGRYRIQPPSSGTAKRRTGPSVAPTSPLPVPPQSPTRSKKRRSRAKGPARVAETAKSEGGPNLNRVASQPLSLFGEQEATRRAVRKSGTFGVQDDGTDYSGTASADEDEGDEADVGEQAEEGGVWGEGDGDVGLGRSSLHPRPGREGPGGSDRRRRRRLSLSEALSHFDLDTDETDAESQESTLEAGHGSADGPLPKFGQDNRYGAVLDMFVRSASLLPVLAVGTGALSTSDEPSSACHRPLPLDLNGGIVQDPMDSNIPRLDAEGQPISHLPDHVVSAAPTTSPAQSTRGHDEHTPYQALSPQFRAPQPPLSLWIPCPPLGPRPVAPLSAAGSPPVRARSDPTPSSAAARPTPRAHSGSGVAWELVHASLEVRRLAQAALERADEMLAAAVALEVSVAVDRGPAVSPGSAEQLVRARGVVRLGQATVRETKAAWGKAGEALAGWDIPGGVGQERRAESERPDGTDERYPRSPASTGPWFPAPADWARQDKQHRRAVSLRLGSHRPRGPRRGASDGGGAMSGQPRRAMTMYETAGPAEVAGPRDTALQAGVVVGSGNGLSDPPSLSPLGRGPPPRDKLPRSASFQLSPPIDLKGDVPVLGPVGTRSRPRPHSMYSAPSLSLAEHERDVGDTVVMIPLCRGAEQRRGASERAGGKLVKRLSASASVRGDLNDGERRRWWSVRSSSLKVHS